MIRVIVSDLSSGDHANAVKSAISLGYGSDISDQIEIKTGGLSADLAYAQSIGAIAVVRSTTGYSSYESTVEGYYPGIQVFMPLGSNTFSQLTTSLSKIISCGAGDAENKNNTAYGNGLEFWDNDYETTTAADASSYSNGVVAGKLLKIKDTLNCGWWETRYRARMTADRTEDNRLTSEWDLYNGYGKINVSNAIAYSESIITDPYLAVAEVEEETEEETDINLNTTILMSQNIFIDTAKENIDNAIRFFRGDTYTVNLYVLTDGSITNLTDYNAILSAKTEQTDTDYVINIHSSNAVVDTLTGKITFTFNPSDTEDLSSGSYYYDVQISNGTSVYTLLSDTLELKPDITRSDLYFNLITDDYEIKLITEDSYNLITENSI